MSQERFLRLLDAAEYLAAHIHEAPVWIVPCLEGGTPTRTSGSSIYPAVQNMLLVARALGLGATLTTLFLNFEKEAEAALGLPRGSMGRVLPGSVAIISTLRRSRNGWRRNLSASIIVVFDPEGRTGCRILTDREIREFALRTPVSRTGLVSSSARPGV
jgi:nitroreductase